MNEDKTTWELVEEGISIFGHYESHTRTTKEIAELMVEIFEELNKEETPEFYKEFPEIVERNKIWEEEETSEKALEKVEDFEESLDIEYWDWVIEYLETWFNEYIMANLAHLSKVGYYGFDEDSGFFGFLAHDEQEEEEKEMEGYKKEDEEDD